MGAPSLSVLTSYEFFAGKNPPPRRTAAKSDDPNIKSIDAVKQDGNLIVRCPILRGANGILWQHTRFIRSSSSWWFQPLWKILL